MVDGRDPGKIRVGDASAIVIALAQTFFALVRSLDPGWSRAYYRFDTQDGGAGYGSSASYVTRSGVVLIPAIKNAPVLNRLDDQGKQLLEVLGKRRGVFVLSIESNFNYCIDYEWHDMTRWRIDKLDGRTGIPDGLPSANRPSQP